METVLRVLDASDVIVALLLAVAAVVTAVRCGRRKFPSTPAWTFVAGTALMLVVSLTFPLTNLVLMTAIDSDHFVVYRSVVVVMYVLNLTGQATVGIGIGLFTPYAAAEARHG